MLLRCLSAIITTMLLAAPSLASELSCNRVFSITELGAISEAQILNLRKQSEKLPASAEEWADSYRSFSQITSNDEFFSARIDAVLKTNSITPPKSWYKRLLNFNADQNERFVDVFNSEPENYIFLAIESSFLKLLNDKVIGKENATALNFFYKTNFLTTVLEEASIKSPELLNLILDQWINFKDQNLKFDSQNDFKVLRIAIKVESPERRAALLEVFQSAYARMKSETINLMETNYPEINALLASKLPGAINKQHIYNGLTANSLADLQRGMKEARLRTSYLLFHYSEGDKPLQSSYIKSIAKFYKIHEKAIKYLSLSPKLAMQAEGKNYPSPEFFRIMKDLAPEEIRARKNSKEEDRDYFRNVQTIINKMGEVKINRGQAMLLVTYYHSIAHLIPNMIHTQTEPLLKSVDTQSKIISADKVNGGGDEMSNVAKQLVLAKNLGSKTQEIAPEKGVQETTLQLGKWSKDLSIVIRSAFPADIHIEALRSGDDLNMIFRREPSEDEMLSFLWRISKHSELLAQSRITWKVYKKNEPIQTGIEELEKVAKRITTSYHKNKSSDSPPLILFAVSAGKDGSTSLVALEPASRLQLEELQSLIVELQKDKLVPQDLNALPIPN